MKYIFLILSICIISVQILAQKQIEIDLIKNQHSTFTKTIRRTGSIDFVIENKVPNHNYDISIEIEQLGIDVLELPLSSVDTLDTKPDSNDAEKIAEVETCNSVSNKFISLLNKVESEKRIGELRDSISDLEITEECKKILKTHFDSYTKDKLNSIYIGSNEQVTLTITKEVTKDSTISWVYIYKREPRGEWQMSYGFGFIYPLISKEDNFYAKSVDTNFVITQGKNNRLLTYAPSFMFSWKPNLNLRKISSNFLNNFSFSGSGGLGTNFESIQVFLGATLSYNQNVKFHIGIAAHKQHFLLGKYFQGDIINESLTFEQLHEEHYRFNPFVSLSFRFDENPFK